MKAGLLASVLALAGLAACSDDTVSKGRADTGVGGLDASSIGPLALQPPMHFVYQADLTYVSDTNEQSHSNYTLGLVIDSADDQGSQGESTISISAERADRDMSLVQNWNPTAGFDSWVDRLGPADDGDLARVANTPVVVHLSAAPLDSALPAGGVAKMLPAAAVFFLDLRHGDAIRAAFFDAYDKNGLMAQAIDPSKDPMGRWVIGFSGNDASVSAYYPPGDKQHTLSLAYDARGWLLSMNETLGDSTRANTAHGSFNLTLTGGP
jgi:hypothetical protein